MITCHKCGFGHKTSEELAACKSWAEMVAEDPSLAKPDPRAESGPPEMMRLPNNSAYPGFNEVHPKDAWCDKAGCIPACSGDQWAFSLDRCPDKNQKGERCKLVKGHRADHFFAETEPASAPDPPPRVAPYVCSKCGVRYLSTIHPNFCPQCGVDHNEQATPSPDTPGADASQVFSFQLAVDLSSEFGQEEYNKRVAPLLRKNRLPDTPGAEPLEDFIYVLNRMENAGADPNPYKAGYPTARQDVLGYVATLRQRLADAERERDTEAASFKNFHRSLCDRFDYCHDPKDWRRDLASLEEHIAKTLTAAQAELRTLKEAAWWVLGENGEFKERGEGGPYWWRIEFRERCGLPLRRSQGGESDNA